MQEEMTKNRLTGDPDIGVTDFRWEDREFQNVTRNYKWKLNGNFRTEK